MKQHLQGQVVPSLTANFNSSHNYHHIQSSPHKIQSVLAEFITAVWAQQDNCREREDVKRFDLESRRVPGREQAHYFPGIISRPRHHQ